jgi:hypothetical protein
MSIESNVSPQGEKCNTCRFAMTHVLVAEDPAIRTVVKCARFPPVRLGCVPAKERMVPIDQRAADTVWPYASVDDWCGEWAARAERPVEPWTVTVAEDDGDSEDGIAYDVRLPDGGNFNVIAVDESDALVEAQRFWEGRSVR